jgi:hypothetical protein
MRILAGRRRLFLMVPAVVTLALVFTGGRAMASGHDSPVVSYMATHGVAMAATESDLLNADEPPSYVIPGQTFGVSEAEGPDSGSDPYMVQDAYFEMSCYDADYNHYSNNTPTLPAYTVPPDPQTSPVVTTMPTYFVQDTVTVPAGCGTSNGSLDIGTPDGSVLYCETTPGYWGGTNTCGGSIYVHVVANPANLPAVPAPLPTSGTVTLYTIVSDAQWQGIQSSGHFSQSANPGVYFYNDISSADSAYNLYKDTYGAGYRIIQTSIGADTLAVDASGSGFIDNAFNLAYYYVGTSALPLFGDFFPIE